MTNEANKQKLIFSFATLQRHSASGERTDKTNKKTKLICQAINNGLEQSPSKQLKLNTTLINKTN
jgi:hypothetical protein